MATRSKAPGTPAQRGKTSGQGEAAPAKPKARRSRSPAAKQPEPESTLAPPEQADQPQLREASSGLVEPPAATGAAGTHELGAPEALKALTEMVAAGIDALAALREEVRGVNRRLDQLAAGRAQPAATSDADDYSFGRDRDPGDAVPPGVAAATPAPLTDTDEAILHTLEELPKRAGRGRRGPRAKA